LAAEATEAAEAAKAGEAAEAAEAAKAGEEGGGDQIVVKVIHDPEVSKCTNDLEKIHS